jgi:ParB family chromosome partitioning protein
MGGEDRKATVKRSKSSPAAPSSAEHPSNHSGGPLLIDIHLIDEDPGQPRTHDNPGFSMESIAELAASFGPNGPKSPISLRVNPEKPGRYLINHGARRTRAGRVKGLSKMPAIIDNDYSEIDQVIENLQRDNLTPREIADWIGREITRGMKKGEIAKAVGKSAAFVSQHANLLNLPSAIESAFNSGRTNDVTVINELVTAFKKNPVEVTEWLAEEKREITRGGVKLLRDFLDAKVCDNKPNDAGVTYEDFGETTDVELANRAGRNKKSNEANQTKLKRPVVLVEHNGHLARLLLGRCPSAFGYTWIKREDDGHEFEARVVEVKLMAVVEG